MPVWTAVSAEEAEAWLIEQVAMRTGLSPELVHVATPFLEFGLGSVDAVQIAGELELRLGRHVSPTAVYNYPSIAALGNGFLIRRRMRRHSPRRILPTGRSRKRLLNGYTTTSAICRMMISRHFCFTRWRKFNLIGNPEGSRRCYVQ